MNLGPASAGGKAKYQISWGENKSANEASLAVVWEREKVAPCFSTFFAFFPLWSLVSGYNVIYFAHLNSCERTHVFHKLVLTT